MIRLLPELAADGPEQMSRDEALLAIAGPPTLRLYRFDPPTVSLGCFQDHAAIMPALPPGMPVVRRITGGGAIWHQHELTYCLAGIPGRDGLPAEVREVYPLLHGAILAALRRRGASLGLQRHAQGDRRYMAEPRCFASPAAADLVQAAGAKVLGSAARVRGGRIILHGSLKLDGNPWDGTAAAGCGLPAAAAAAALREGVCAALGRALAPGVWSTAELDAAAGIRAARYGDAGWVVSRSGPRP